MKRLASSKFLKMHTYFDEIDAIDTGILHNVTHERWFFSVGARHTKNRENS